MGTRPEIIKMSPIIRECERLRLDYFILHTGQHYSYNMNRVFFDQLELPEAKYDLGVGSGSHAEQTGKMLVGIEKVLREETPDIVLVEGDTNTVLAAALAAVKLGIMVGHVEAGLRCYDRKMPEEINRILVDHCSDYLFAPTEKSKQNLLNEGIPQERAFVTGNTIVDAVLRNLEIADRRVNVLNKLGLDDGEYFVATIHRQENVDDERRLRGIAKGLERVRREFKMELVYPVHPRTRKRLRTLGLNLNDVTLVQPLDYLSFLQLEKHSKLVLTDSGGVQEEACILGVPCVTLRDSTERPETLDVGSNSLAGITYKRIVQKVKLMLTKRSGWKNPFGDGKAGRMIIRVLRRELD